MNVPDILIIVHLDDNFVHSKIEALCKFLKIPLVEPIVLLNDKSFLDIKTKDIFALEIIKGLNQLKDLIVKIKDTSAKYLYANKNLKIFLLHYYVSSVTAKTIYVPMDKYIFEIKNSGDLLDRNKTQSIFFLDEFENMKYNFAGNIKIEIGGVYRYACVNSVNTHLTNFITQKKFNIEKWVNTDLTL